MDGTEDRGLAAEAGRILRLGWPMVVTQLFIMGMGFVDTVMAGRYSAADLAGVALGGNVFWPLVLFMAGLNLALTPIVAQLRGAGQTYKAGEKVRQGLWIALICGAVMVWVSFNIRPLYEWEWLSVDPLVIDIAARYLAACAFGVVPALIYMSLRFTAEGLGVTRPPMLIAGGALALNIPVNYVFIYGKFGAPELGGVGCGVATAVVYWFEMLAILLVARLPFFRVTGFWRHFSWPKWRGFLEILRIGLPIGTASFVGMALFSVIGFLVARMGVSELAAHSIAGNLNWLTYVLPMALGSAISIRVGFVLGAEDGAALRRVLKAAMRLIGAYGILVTLLLVLFRRPMVAIYISDATVFAIAVNLMLFLALYQILDDLLAAVEGALLGFKDTLVPMLIQLVCYWFVCLPLGYVFAEGLLPGAPGVYGYWLALSLGIALAACWTGLRLYLTTRRALWRLEA